MPSLAANGECLRNFRSLMARSIIVQLESFWWVKPVNPVATSDVLFVHRSAFVFLYGTCWAHFRVQLPIRYFSSCHWKKVTSTSKNEITIMLHQYKCKMCSNGHPMICASRPAHFGLKAPQFGLGSVEPVWERPWTHCFQCVWGPQCIGVCQRSPPSCEYSEQQRKKQLCSLKQPQGADVSPFHDWKSPPERDNKVTLTWQFPAVLLCVSKENARKHLRATVKVREAQLDPMLPQGRILKTGSERRRTWRCCLGHNQNPPELVLFAVVPFTLFPFPCVNRSKTPR